MAESRSGDIRAASSGVTYKTSLRAAGGPEGPRVPTEPNARTSAQLSVSAVCQHLMETGVFRRKCAAPTIFVSAALPRLKALFPLVGARGFEPPAPSSRS